MIGESKVICKQPGRYIGWPTVGKTADGEILAVFSGDRDAHVCPFGKSFLVRSSDNGEQWSEPELINDSPLDDRDTGLCCLADGSVVMSWFTSHYLQEKYLEMYQTNHPEWLDKCRQKLASIGDEDVRAWVGEGDLNEGRYPLGKWTRRSTDGGRTWEAPVAVPATTPHGPIELHDGRLLFFGIEGSDRREKRQGLAAAESADKGRSWKLIAKVNGYPDYPGTEPDGWAYLCEPHVVEVGPGHIVGMARCEVRPHRRKEWDRLYTFESTDGGRTWTEPTPTEIIGKPPHLLRLADGRLLCTYGYRHEPFGQRACLSADGGRTWDYDREIVLRDDAPSGDLGYPASVEIDPGTILTVYYQKESAGEQTCLMATRWQVP